MTDRTHKEQREHTRQKINQYFTNPKNYPAVLTALQICDGHTIFEPSDFQMLPEFVRDHLARVNLGETTGKNAIHLPDDSVTTELFGIYGLDVLETAARAHKVTSPKNGRGFRATDLKEQLRIKLTSTTSDTTTHP